LVPTVSLISWIGTPLLLMIETAVRRPSWACRRPMPARRVIVLNRQLSWSDVNGSPFSWRNTRSLSRQASPAFRRSRSCLALYAVSAAIARLSPNQVHVIPREVAQLAGAQAEGD